MSEYLEHVHAIQNLKARYCLTIDRAAGDPTGVRPVFAALFLPDVIADYGFEPMHGAPAVAEFLCTAIAASSAWALHMLHTPLILVDGNRAMGQWTVMAQMKRREGGQVDMVLGRYADEFHLAADGWRIARVTFARLA